MNYYCNFQRYNQRGDRMAIFGEIGGDGNMLITTIRCSKNDHFSKATAHAAFAAHIRTGGKSVFHSAKTIIIPIEERGPKITFQQWCKDNYYRLGELWVETPYVGKQAWKSVFRGLKSYVTTKVLMK